MFASDAVVEDVHFRLGLSTLSQVIQKVVTANVSDVFAMGGRPAGIVFTAGLPVGCNEEALVSIVDGLRRSCDAYSMRLFGGDTVRSPGGYFFDVAILGSLPDGIRPLRRSGARPGDALALFGETGGSLAGLRILEALAGDAKAAKGLEGLVPTGREAALLLDLVPGFSLENDDGVVLSLCRSRGLAERASAAALMMRRHLCPRAHLHGALLQPGAREAVHAAIDISDGLSRDLRSLCEESGVGAVIDAAAVPVPAAVRDAAGFDASLAIALESGEEYVLLAALADPAAVGGGAVVIGEVVEAEQGVLLRTGAGDIADLPETGYEHEF
ncbi:MAG: AIR synthase related protein [Candidatus Krumholzibacteria bacterium]|nr:AIR synthase related protein [Candidatus Krumholzibacteria bacterium]